MIAALREAAEHRELLSNLTLRELRIRYRRSLLGWGWSLLNPLVLTACYTFVFGTLLHVRPAPGVPSGNNLFAFFLVVGLLPWNYFAGGITVSTDAVLRAHHLISKVYFPRELIVFATVLSLLVTLLIELGVVLVLMFLFGHLSFSVLPWLIVALILQTLFVTGVALGLSALSVRSRDIPYLTGMVLTVWFFFTPIVYSDASVPERRMVLGYDLPLRKLYLLNPMARFTHLYRSVLWDGRAPGTGTVLGLAILTATVFTVGYWFFTRRARYFAEDL